MALTAGTILGQYEIRSPLGAGGMGEVYRAHDTRLDREVAIKVLPESLISDPERLRRFEQEARAAAALNHPNILAVYQMGTHGGVSYMVAELLDGETLRERLHRGPIPLRKAIDYAVQFAHGLAAAHEKGIVHRDLKPENLFVTKDGRVKILDFGLAKLLPTAAPSADGRTVTLQEQTEPGVVMGTVGYMSPEQVRGEIADPRSDIFAFGAVLYEMVTGKPSFRKPTKAETMTAILNEDPPSISQLAPIVPPGLQRVVHCCLEKSPEQRFHSAHDLAFALEALTDSATSPPSGSVKARWYGLAAAVAATAIGVTVWITPPRVSGPLDSQQITNSAEPKEGPLFTDGSRLYLQSRGEPSEMAVSGGLIAPLRVVEPGMRLLDVPADLSRALAWKPDPSDETGGGSLWVVSLLGGKPRRLGNSVVQAARWSPDGQSIVFATLRTLFSSDENGENIRKIWDAPGFIRDLCFSPDGRQITATADTPDVEHQRLWMLKANGENAHLLLSDWPNDAVQGSGQWTSNGRHFLFMSDREGRANVYEMVAPSWFEFWRKPNAVRITGNQLEIQASVPARDGGSLFVLGIMEQGAMQAFDPHTKKHVPFLGGLPALEFVISPDRQWMAYTEYPSGYLWKSRLDGSDKVQLTNHYAVMQQWSPDGKSLVYSDWSKLYLVSADGGKPEKLIASGEHEVEPTWSADGKSIVFSYYNFAEEPLNGIHVLDLATRKTSLMPGSMGFYVPSWSPDGRFLVAIAQNPSRMMLYTAATKSWTELTRFDAPWGYWAWSSDSKSLYMALVQGQNGIYRLTVPEGHWEKLSGLDDIDANPLDSFVSLTPEGQPAIMSRTGVAQVYSLRWKR